MRSFSLKILRNSSENGHSQEPDDDMKNTVLLEPVHCHCRVSGNTDASPSVSVEAGGVGGGGGGARKEWLLQV